MAISSNTVFEVRTTGSDSSGGGFVEGASGTDYSQQDAAQVAIDNSSITTSITTNVITFTAGYTASAADVGNIVQMLTGTNVTAGFYEITGQTATTWTMDRNVVTSGTTTNATGNMGGALASPGKMGAAVSSANGVDAWIASGTYDVTSPTANISGGRVNITSSFTGTNMVRIRGYDQTRGDNTGTRPIIRSGVNGLTLFTTTGEGVEINNLAFEKAAANNTVNGVTAAPGTFVYRCKFSDFDDDHHCYLNLSLGVLLECSGGSSDFAAINIDGGAAYYCVVGPGDGRGFSLTSNSSRCVGCIAYERALGDAGQEGDGFFQPAAVGHTTVANCTSYNNEGDGFDFRDGTSGALINCISYGNGGLGFRGVTSSPVTINCAAGDNDGGDFSANLRQFGSVSLTTTPFVDADDLDFSLNSTDGGGAECVAAGIPGTFPQIPNTVSHLDIGAVQSEGGSGTINSLTALLCIPRGLDIKPFPFVLAELVGD